MAQLSGGSHPTCNIIIVKWSNSPKFTTVQQSIRPKSNHPDFQTRNVRFTKSDRISSAKNSHYNCHDLERIF